MPIKMDCQSITARLGQTGRIVISCLVIGATVTGFRATACDEPGTPNREQAFAISPTAIRVYWHNTANEPGIYFDIEGRSDPSINNFGPYDLNPAHLPALKV